MFCRYQSRKGKVARCVCVDKTENEGHRDFLSYREKLLSFGELEATTLELKEPGNRFFFGKNKLNVCPSHSLVRNPVHSLSSPSLQESWRGKHPLPVVASLLMHSSLFDSLVFSRTVKQVWTESSKRSGRANANTMTDVEAGVATSNNGTSVNHHLPQHHPNHHQIHLPLSSNATAKTNAGPLPSVDTSVSATNGVNGNATSTSASNVDKSTENAGGSRRRSVEEHAPSSGIILPASIAAMAAKKQQHKEPQLIHPILLKIPLQFRFGCTGMISNLLFMIIYNMAVTHISSIQASIIYAVVYFFFIPASHLMVSLFVFGWPAKYWASLLSNFPIGLCFSKFYL